MTDQKAASDRLALLWNRVLSEQTEEQGGDVETLWTPAFKRWLAQAAGGQISIDDEYRQWTLEEGLNILQSAQSPNKQEEQGRVDENDTPNEFNGVGSAENQQKEDNENNQQGQEEQIDDREDVGEDQYEPNVYQHQGQNNQAEENDFTRKRYIQNPREDIPVAEQEADTYIPHSVNRAAPVAPIPSLPLWTRNLYLLFQHYCRISIANGPQTTFEAIQHKTQVMNMSKFMIFWRDWMVEIVDPKRNDAKESAARTPAEDENRSTNTQTRKIESQFKIANRNTLNRAAVVEMYKKHAGNSKDLDLNEFMQLMIKVGERIGKNETLYDQMGLKDEIQFREKATKLGIAVKSQLGAKIAKKQPINYKFKFTPTSQRTTEQVQEELRERKANRSNRAQQLVERKKEKPLGAVHHVQSHSKMKRNIIDTFLQPKKNDGKPSHSLERVESQRSRLPIMPANQIPSYQNGINSNNLLRRLNISQRTVQGMTGSDNSAAIPHKTDGTKSNNLQLRPLIPPPRKASNILKDSDELESSPAIGSYAALHRVRKEQSQGARSDSNRNSRAITTNMKLNSIVEEAKAIVGGPQLRSDARNGQLIASNNQTQSQKSGARYASQADQVLNHVPSPKLGLQKPKDLLNGVLFGSDGEDEEDEYLREHLRRERKNELVSERIEGKINRIRL